MQDSDFKTRMEQTLESLELALDDLDADIDYQNNGGVLTVEFESGATMVFSPQVANHQLWLATPAGGFHFEYDEEAADWRCTRSGEYFRPFVVQQVAGEGGLVLDLG